MKRTPTQTAHSCNGMFDKLDQEFALARRLRDHGVTIFGGTADSRVDEPEDRKKTFRQSIQLHGLDLVICSKNNRTNKPMTFAQVFESLYGEKL